MEVLSFVIGVGTVVIVVAVVVAWRGRRPRRRLEDDPGAVLRLGNEVRWLGPPPKLPPDPDVVAITHELGYRADRDGRADVAEFTVDGHRYALVGELEPTVAELEGPNGPVMVRGVQGQFVSPPDGHIVRERTVLLGTPDAELGSAILDAFRALEGREADATIPWTLEGASRYAAKYLINRSVALSARVEEPGELVVRFPDGADGRIHLSNLFLQQMQSADPTEALEALRRFLDSVSPADQTLERDQLMLRVHRGTPPVVLSATLASGEEVTREVAAHPIGDDLSIIYVQDLPDRMRYLGPHDAEALEPDPAARLALARTNLARGMQRIRILGDGPIFMVLCGGSYEASLIELAELWDVLDPLLDGARLVVLPARDLLFVTGDANEERRRQMLTLARPQADLAYPISDGVYRWRDGDATWERLDL